MAEARLELAPAVASSAWPALGQARSRLTIRLSRRSGSGWFCSISARPDATDYWSMRRYLSEFLSDRRVIDYPPGCGSRCCSWSS